MYISDPSRLQWIGRYAVGDDFRSDNCTLVADCERCVRWPCAVSSLTLTRNACVSAIKTIHDSSLH